jgi:hypothetical protein
MEKPFDIGAAASLGEIGDSVDIGAAPLFGKMKTPFEIGAAASLAEIE